MQRAWRACCHSAHLNSQPSSRAQWLLFLCVCIFKDTEFLLNPSAAVILLGGGSGKACVNPPICLRCVWFIIMLKRVLEEGQGIW